MKLNKKLLILISIVFFILAGTAYASSSQFLSQAQKYIDKNCGKNKLSDDTALLCYLFNKVQEHDASITNINATISPIPSQITSLQASTSALNNSVNNLQNTVGKSIHVLDANNQDLGLYMWDDDNLTTYIFIPSLNKKVIIQDFQIPRTFLFYSSTDCTGTPYAQVNPIQLNDVYSVAPGKYFVASVNGRTGLNAQSRQQWSNNTLTCGSYVAGVGGVVQVTPVNLPFSEPIATPLQFRYQ